MQNISIFSHLKNEHIFTLPSQITENSNITLKNNFNEVWKLKVKKI